MVKIQSGMCYVLEATYYLLYFRKQLLRILIPKGNRKHDTEMHGLSQRECLSCTMIQHVLHRGRAQRNHRNYVDQHHSYILPMKIVSTFIVSINIKHQHGMKLWK